MTNIPQLDRCDYIQFNKLLRGTPIKEINKLWGAYNDGLISNDDVEEYTYYYHMMQKQSKERHSKYGKYNKKIEKKYFFSWQMDLKKWKLKRKRWLTSKTDNYALTQY